MGLLSRLAKIGSGIVRQALSPKAVPTDEEVEIHHPDAGQTRPSSAIEESIESVQETTVSGLEDEPADIPSDAVDHEAEEASSVQSTQRDGHRRSL